MRNKKIFKIISRDHALLTGKKAPLEAEWLEALANKPVFVGRGPVPREAHLGHSRS